MQEREFNFTLRVAGVSELTDEVANTLFEAGCDDATPAMRDGQLYVTFTRLAEAHELAVFSAIHQIEGCGIGARVTGIE